MLEGDGGGEEERGVRYVRFLYARLWELVGMHFPNPASFSLNWEFV